MIDAPKPYYYDPNDPFEDLTADEYYAELDAELPRSGNPLSSALVAILIAIAVGVIFVIVW